MKIQPLRYLYSLIVLMLPAGCNNSTLDEDGFRDLLKTPGVEVTDTFTFKRSKIFRIYRDYGFGGASYYIFHKKGSDYYHKLDNRSNYVAGQIWNNYILQTCSYLGQASDTGQWITIQKRITPANHEEILFNYCNEIVAGKEDGCIYKMSGGKLLPFGKLTDYCSIQDLDTGIYYLAPPGIFYTSKTDIKELEDAYR